MVLKILRLKSRMVWSEDGTKEKELLFAQALEVFSSTKENRSAQVQELAIIMKPLDALGQVCIL